MMIFTLSVSSSLTSSVSNLVVTTCHISQPAGTRIEYDSNGQIKTKNSCAREVWTIHNYILVQYISRHSQYTPRHSVYSQYTLGHYQYTPSIFSVYSQYIPSIFPVYSQYILSIFPVYSQYIPSIFSVYSQYIPSIFSVYSQYNSVEFIVCAEQVGTTVALHNLFHTLPVRHKEFQRNLKKVAMETNPKENDT